MEPYFRSGGSAGSGSRSGSPPVPLARTSRRLAASMSPPSAFPSPAYNAFASATSDLDPTLLRLARSCLLRSDSSSDQSAAARRLLQVKSSPLGLRSAAAAAAAAYKTPVKVVEMEEDVLVMDGVLVSDARANAARAKSSAEIGSNNLVNFKTELCRSWEELGICRFGTKCQFAHGKEELRCDVRGPRPWKQRFEVMGSSVGSRSTPSPGSLYSNKLCRYISLPGPNTPDLFLPANAAAAATPEDLKTPIAATVEVAPIAPPMSSTSFSWPPTKEENALITRVLYGPSSRCRLPVFEQICSQCQ